METKKYWCVVDCNGNCAGHELDKLTAQNLATCMQEREPDAEWQAIGGDEEAK